MEPLTEAMYIVLCLMAVATLSLFYNFNAYFLFGNSSSASWDVVLYVVWSALLLSGQFFLVPS